MKRLRALFESIVFADMKPGARTEQTQGRKSFAPVASWWERVLSGGAQKDPLYLTNRSTGQKIKAWSVIAVPCLLIIGFVAITLSRDYFDPPEVTPQKEMTAEEVSRKLLPNMAKDIQIETNHDVEVSEAHVETASMKLTGRLKNNSTKRFAAVDVVFNLTDSTGSQVGAVNGHVENLDPKAVKAFEFPIQQRNAAFALVRELSLSR
jgi:hypothetical protein